MNKKQIFKLLKIAAIVYVVIGVVLYFTQEYFIFHGVKVKKDTPYEFPNQKFTEHNITRTDGSNLNFIKFLPLDSATQGVVIYYHGNMRNISRYAAYTKLFTINGYEVWMMDYPSFGKTTGKRTEESLYTDAQTIYNLAKQKMSTDSILIYGKSIGTGIATHIAARNACKRVLLETPYYSLSTVYDDFTFIYPTKFLLKYQFPSYKNIPLIKAPITIFHGTKDELIGYKNASRLKPLLKPIDEFVTIEKARHNNVMNFQIYTDKVDSLLSL
jgi:uncharacterized protein